MRPHVPLACALALVVVGACAGVSVDTTSTTAATVRTAINPAATFDRYRTFSIGRSERAPAGYVEAASDVELRRRVAPAVAAALVRRGYVEVPADGDLVVTLGLGRREVSIHEQSSISAEWLPDDEITDFVEGALVIDVVDGSKGVRVWHGSSQSRIDPEKEDQRVLQHAVDSLIARFPAAPTVAPAAK